MPLAKTAVALLTEHAACEDAFAKRVIAGLISWLCRHAKSQHFYISKAAQRKARERGLGSLAQYTWRDQRGSMIDTDRSIFHWDHYVTVKEMQRELLSLQQTGNKLGRILEQLERLLQVDDVDPVALAEDVLLHPRVPALGLMPEVNTRFEQLLHCDRGQEASFLDCIRVVDAGARIVPAVAGD